MSGVLTEMTGLAQRLLQPEHVPTDDAERDHARQRVQDAVLAGSVTGEQAGTAMTRLANAQTRGDLRRALSAVPGGAAPAALGTALRAVTALGTCAVVVQFVVWMLISLVGFHWTEPWWLWTAVTVPFVIAPLWWLNESHYRIAARPLAGGQVQAAGRRH